MADNNNNSTDEQASALDQERDLESILPSGEVHLLAGASGAGKTSFTINLARSVKAGVPFLGYETRPQCVSWVSADRSLRSLRRTFERCRVAEKDIGEIISLVDLGVGLDLKQVMTKISPETKFLVIDPLLALMKGDSNAYCNVAAFMVRLSTMCGEHGITLLGLMHTSKMREKDLIVNPRERILGSVAWAGYCETVLYLQAESDNANGSEDRRLRIYPRNAPAEEHDFRFAEDGQLLLVEDVHGYQNLRAWVSKTKSNGERFRRRDAIAWGSLNGVAERTVEMHLQKPSRKAGSGGLIEGFMNHPNGIQQAPTPTFAETLPMHMQTLTFPIRKASASLREFPQHPQCFRMPLRKPNYIIINSIERVSAIFQVGRSGDSVPRSLAPVLDQGATVIRCGMYSRISTRDKGQDLDNQRSQLLAFANSQGWQVVKEYADIESGAKADRPQFVAMMAAAAKREFDVLLFWALDRLSREGVWETHQYLARLDSYGVRFRSYSEPYLDSCGIFREAVISILATVAKQERLRLRERIRAGLERVGEKGTRSGKPVGRPRLVVRRDHIHQLRQDGLSWAEIARKTGLSVGTCRRACQQWEVYQKAEEPCQNLADKKREL